MITIDLFGLFFSNPNLKCLNMLEILLLLLKINYISLPKPSEVIMALNFYYLPFMLQRALLIIGLVLRLQQNGRVERKHQHLLNVGRALLYQSKLFASYWYYALLHATFIINRLTSPHLHNKSPYHLLHNHIPDVHCFKVFGSLCYSTPLQAHKTKLSSRARKSVFLGYTIGFKGYVLLDINTREIHISRNVSFH